VGVISAMVEKVVVGIGGKELWLWLWSQDRNATWRRKELLPYAGQLSVHFGSIVISPTLHCSDLSVICRLLRLDYSRCSAAGGVRKRPRGWNNVVCRRNHTLTAIYWKHFSRMPPVWCGLDVEVNRKLLYNHLLKGLQRHLG
jgi:hypothetical protein